MIRYALRCEQDHRFEAWFRDSDAFDRQVAAGAVLCPDCGSSKVEKTLMAPSVSPSSKRSPAAAPRTFFNQVREYRAKVLAETEDVGRAFSTQARQMHEGEIEHRSIRGEATQEEAKSLQEDGVPILPVPPEPPAEN